MVKVLIGTKVCSFEEMLEEYGRVCEENEKLKKQIFELESELSVKEDFLKLSSRIKNIGEEIEKIEKIHEDYEEKNTELPIMPIDVASMLINARNGISDKYSKDDLLEIIEHLRVFINNPSGY